MMKAVRLHRQGGPEQLVYEDAPEPELFKSPAGTERTWSAQPLRRTATSCFILGRMRSSTIGTRHLNTPCARSMSFWTTIGGETRERSWQVLKPSGMLISLPGPIPEHEAVAHNKRGTHGVFFIVQPNREQLGEIAALTDFGAIRPVIAETIPLAKARQAFHHSVARVGGHQDACSTSALQPARDWASTCCMPRRRYARSTSVSMEDGMPESTRRP